MKRRVIRRRLVTPRSVAAQPVPEPVEPAVPKEEQPLCLDQCLKLCGAVGTGGEAKVLIQSGEVILNGQIETRRRKKLQIGDIIEIDGHRLEVTETPRETPEV